MRPQEKCSARSWLLLDLAVSFMFCVFAPLEAYFSNESEYWFHLSHLLPVVLGVFASVFFVLALFSAAIWRTRLSRVVYAFLLVLLVFFYIQGNYIPRPYGVLNGAEIDWNADKFRGLGNASVALLVTAVCVWGLAVALRPLRRRIFEIGHGLCLVLCGLQVVTLLTLYLQNNVFEDNSSPTILMTDDKWLDLSPTNNVLIVLLDTFDGTDMNDILEGPEGDFVRDALKDFTYYPDTLGLYPTTKGAVPHILTGKVYTNEIPFSDYLAQAYGEAPLYKEMAKRGYSVCAYSDLRLMNRDVSVFENIYPGVSRIANKPLFAKTLYSLVAFNYLPHQLKRHFVVPDDAFMALRKTLTKSRPYSESMQRFYKGLKDESVNLANIGNVFKFYHVRGVHPPFNFGKDLVPRNDVKFTYQDASLGCVTLLKRFFQKLEEVRVYDASTIIVMADHGHVRYSQNPLFFVKNRAERHDFRISNAQMSFRSFPDLMLNLVRDGIGITEESIAAQSNPGESRYFLSYRWDDSWSRRYLPLIHEMRLDGHAALPRGATFEQTGRHFGGQVRNDDFKEYVLGTPLQFGKTERQATRDYLASGFGMASKNYIWTCEKEAVMRFRLDRLVEDLKVEFNCETYNGVQTVILHANDTEICREEFAGRKTLTFAIPRSCIGKNRCLTLKFTLPRAISPDEIKHDGNTRQLALRLFKMRLYSSGEEDVYEKSFSFAGTDGAPARRLCLQGVGRPEREFTWTIGDELKMEFPVNPQRSTPLSVTLQYGTFLPKERVVVSANGHKIANYVAKGEEKRTFVIPPSIFSKDATVTLTFALPDAISPKERGMGGDNRKLALRLYSVTRK